MHWVWNARVDYQETSRYEHNKLRHILFKFTRIWNVFNKISIANDKNQMEIMFCSSYDD